MISYFYDIYSCLVILIFQVGIVIRHDDMKNVGNQITLILCVYTALCLLYIIAMDKSIFSQNFINTEEVHNMYDEYKRNREEISFYYNTHKFNT